MAGFIVATVLVLWLAGVVFAFAMSVDTGSPWWIAAGAVWIILGLGVLFNAMGREEAKGPCLRYETSMHYNPATKTVMPARRCVDRAEWVQP